MRNDERDGRTADLTPRQTDVDVVADVLRAYAGRSSEIRAAMVVGSYAYGRPSAASDSDFVIVTRGGEGPRQSVASRLVEAIDALLVPDAERGALHEQRFRTSAVSRLSSGSSTPPGWRHPSMPEPREFSPTAAGPSPTLSASSGMRSTRSDCR
jgi:predicted nucleotidyltransferase